MKRAKAAVHALDVLAVPVRRRILEFLSDGEQSAGDVTEEIQKELGITQAAVSQHLRALRESGFVRVHIQGPQRIYGEGPQTRLTSRSGLTPTSRQGA